MIDIIGSLMKWFRVLCAYPSSSSNLIKAVQIIITSKIEHVSRPDELKETNLNQS